MHTFRSFREEPEIVAMMNEENLHHARNIRGSASIPALYNTLSAQIALLLDKGKESGVFRANVDPMSFYIAVSGMGYFYCSNRHTLGAIFQADLFEPERIALYETQMADMVLAYLKSQKM
jgi:TetR/AcrR family transcriptional regulator